MKSSMFFITRIDGDDYGRGIEFDDADLSLPARTALANKIGQHVRRTLALIEASRAKRKGTK